MGAEENLLFVSARCQPSGESAGFHLTQHNLPQFTNNNIIHTVAGSSSSSTSILISLFHHPLNQQEEQQQYKDPWTVHTFYTLLTLHHDHGCHLMKCRIKLDHFGHFTSNGEARETRECPDIARSLYAVFSARRRRDHWSPPRRLPARAA